MRITSLTFYEDLGHLPPFLICKRVPSQFINNTAGHLICGGVISKIRSEKSDEPPPCAVLHFHVISVQWWGPVLPQTSRSSGPPWQGEQTN